jgi:hypothetical protein
LADVSVFDGVVLACIRKNQWNLAKLRCG